MGTNEKFKCENSGNGSITAGRKKILVRLLCVFRFLCMTKFRVLARNSLDKHIPHDIPFV